MGILYQKMKKNLNPHKIYCSQNFYYVVLPVLWNKGSLQLYEKLDLTLELFPHIYSPIKRPFFITLFQLLLNINNIFAGDFCGLNLWKTFWFHSIFHSFLCEVALESRKIFFLFKSETEC